MRNNTPLSDLEFLNLFDALLSCGEGWNLLEEGPEYMTVCRRLGCGFPRVEQHLQISTSGDIYGGNLIQSITNEPDPVVSAIYRYVGIPYEAMRLLCFAFHVPVDFIDNPLTRELQKQGWSLSWSFTSGVTNIQDAQPSDYVLTAMRATDTGKNVNEITLFPTGNYNVRQTSTVTGERTNVIFTDDLLHALNTITASFMANGEPLVVVHPRVARDYLNYINSAALTAKNQETRNEAAEHSRLLTDALTFVAGKAAC